MRIFELAKTLKTTSSELLRQAQVLELEAHSALSSLDDDDVQALKRHMASVPASAKPKKADAEARRAAKRKRAAKRSEEMAKAERERLNLAADAARGAVAQSSGKVDDEEHAEVPAQKAPEAKPELPPKEDPKAKIPEIDEPAITAEEIKIEPLPPGGDADKKVIIHAEPEALDAESKDDEVLDDTIDPSEEQIDPDEALAHAYLGSRAEITEAKDQPMRPTRDASPPRPTPGKPVRPPVPSRGAKTDTARKTRSTPVAKKTPTGAAKKPERKAKGRRGEPAPIRGKQPILRGQPPIIRGQQPIVRGQQNESTPKAGAPQTEKSKRAMTPEKPRFAPVVATAPASDKVLLLRGPTPLKDLAEKMGIRPNKLIADLMQMNVLVSINQRVDLERAGKIAEKYGYSVELERTRRSAKRKPAIRRLDEEDHIPDDKPEDMETRPPVVTFLGHVDHGKTSLMDRIRKSQVVTGEAGGITQHIGAYSVELTGRKITFLDTPGHAAFSAMRARGANLTDIAVIIIAADDGIMPQTREAIRQAQQAEVQLMVAINKCDLPNAKPDRIKQQLQAENLTPEEWGGDLVVCEVSATTGKGVEHLLEMILLQADMLELQANPNRRAEGYVIEAQLELGRGPTATLLVTSGTLKVGDVILVGEHFGRLRGLMDDRGRKVREAPPATAVSVMGISGVPEPSAEFRVMVNDKRARELAEKFAAERKEKELTSVNRTVTMDSLLDKLSEQKKKQLSVIVKGDTQGSVEAIVDSLRDIRSEKITLDILTTGIGNVSTNDVQRAATSDAVVLGFQVGIDTGVAAEARHEKVRVHTYRIIYELFDYVKQTMLDMLDPEYEEVVKGHAQIRAIFDIGGMGRVAGCQLLDGLVNVKHRVRVKRARDIVFDGRISSLRHFQEEVAEVRDMQECGIFFDGFEDFKEGDIVECYAMEELERTL